MVDLQIYIAVEEDTTYGEWVELKDLAYVDHLEARVKAAGERCVAVYNERAGVTTHATRYGVYAFDGRDKSLVWNPVHSTLDFIGLIEGFLEVTSDEMVVVRAYYAVGGDDLDPESIMATRFEVSECPPDRSVANNPYGTPEATRSPEQLKLDYDASAVAFAKDILCEGEYEGRYYIFHKY